MPWLKRKDGVLVTGLTDMERIVPYVMPFRNDSVVYTDLALDVSQLKRWLWAYNRASPQAPVSIMHMLLYLLPRFFEQYPEFERFVSGGRIYQRTRSTVSLIVKDSLTREGRSAAVKMSLAAADESLPAYIARVNQALLDARGKPKDDPLTRMVLRLPGWCVSLLVGLQRCLDRWNLLPDALTRDDPLYTSCFMANLGSLGLTGGYHHLYEYGACSMFVVVGAIEKTAGVDADGAVGVRDILRLGLTFDARVVDGMTGALAAKFLKKHVEEPQHVFGAPEEAVRGVVAKPAAASVAGVTAI